MKGVILAGGSGTRLRPLTTVVCKQLLPVYDKPMVFYPLSTLIHAGVTEVLVVTSPNELGKFQNLLGDGSRIGISIEYIVQEFPGGLPQGILLAEEFLQGEKFWFILGDNLFHGPSFGATLRSLTKSSSSGATVFAYRVMNASQYGVVNFKLNSEDVDSLEEKPLAVDPGWAVPGLYLLDETAVERAKNLKPSKRQELEIIDLLDSYRLNDSLMAIKVSRGNAWFDLGTPDNLLMGAHFVQAIQTRQGLLIGSPEEASLHAGNITQGEFRDLAREGAGSAYFELLLSHE